jgi:hypothetical protein
MNETSGGSASGGYPQDIQVGICSLCGCAVTTPSIWTGYWPPPKTCKNCGAVEAPQVLQMPVIPMMRKQE